MASDLDTVFVNLRIDQDPSSSSKTEAILYQGTWSWMKILFVALIALCIIGIILAIIFIVIGKKPGKNKQPKPISSSSTTKHITSAGIKPEPKYQQVRNP